MTTDRYTKAVLTIIALSLSIIAIQLTTRDAHAQSGQFVFTQSGALIVSVCDPSGTRSRYTCADVLNEGVTVVPRR
jgi:hypothetical protein